MRSVGRTDVVVVGAGIVGLAHALAAARQHLDVVVLEKDARALGASIRNFGLVWPVGQRRDYYETALRSRELWLEIAAEAGLWVAECGSLTVARWPEEVAVLEEFLAAHSAARDRGCRLLEPDEVVRRSPVVRRDGLCAALWSPTELNVDPRLAIPAVAGYLAARYGVRFEFSTTVTGVEAPEVHTSRGTWLAEQVVVCTGADFGTIYPEVYAAAGLRQCKLQMMRTVPQSDGWQLGPALCRGLSLLHYASHESAASLPALRRLLARTHPDQLDWGVHALVSQTPVGELSLGDTHEYGTQHDPFIREPPNQLVLDYLAEFVELPDAEIAERWHGIYATCTDGRVFLSESPGSGVTVVNGLGGSGMTLAFALAEELFLP